MIPNIFLNKEKVRQGYNADYDKRFYEDSMEGEGIGEEQTDDISVEEIEDEV